MKSFTGKVVANKMAKTVVVERDVNTFHKLYKKLIRRQRRIKVHTEIALQVGELVRVTSCRPLSKDKRYQVAAKI